MNLYAARGRHSRERACEKIGATANSSVVMARLDRAIHEKSNEFSVVLDGRVKPGHDNGERCRFSHTLFRGNGAAADLQALELVSTAGSRMNLFLRPFTHIVCSLCLAGAALLAVLAPAAPAWSETIRVSLAQLPILAESPDKGTLIDLFNAMHEADPSVDFKIAVEPFARSISNVVNGNADIHLPLLRPAPDKLETLPYLLGNINFFNVVFVLYYNKDKDVDIKNIGRYRIETDVAHVNLFDFPVIPRAEILAGLKRVDAGRVDGYLFASHETDHVLKASGLKNIRRKYYATYEVNAVLPRHSDKHVEATLERLINMLKTNGRYAKIMAPLNYRFEDWQTKE